MNTTGPGWTDAGKKKYFHPGSLKKLGSLAKTKSNDNDKLAGLRRGKYIAAHF